MLVTELKGFGYGDAKEKLNGVFSLLLLIQ